MLLKNVSNQIKTVVSVLFISYLSISISQAKSLHCEFSDVKNKHPKFCQASLKDARAELIENTLTATLVTDAPLRLLEDTQSFWLNRLSLCKNRNCLQQQFNLRNEDLNIYTSLNQSLTQHFIKFENGTFAERPTHLKIHQLSKDRIKIEGLAYRNPNNSAKTQLIPLLAYTSPEKKHQILDNENDCKYQLNFQKAILIVNTQQKGCERFTGVYRLYD